MPNYQNGQIYKIFNDENDILYIGSTTSALYARMKNHRQKSEEHSRARGLYPAMRSIGVDSFNILLIKKAPCNNREELEAVEYTIIQKYLKRGFVLYNLNYGKGSLAGAKSHMFGMKGMKCPAFKRGYLARTKNISSPSWLFTWYEDQIKRTRSFSINKYGAKKAEKMAKKLRDEIYPLSDSE